MTVELNAMPDGEIFAASDRMIKAESVESLLVAGILLGRPGTEIQLHLTIQGTLNHSDEPADVTVAFSPDDALGLVDTILTTLQAMTRTDGAI